jgi:hypothetical protein
MMEQMGLQTLKHCICSHDHGLAVLLVDIESERVPRRNAQGKLLYYCLRGQHVFSLPLVAADEQASESNQQDGSEDNERLALCSLEKGSPSLV